MFEIKQLTFEAKAAAGLDPLPVKVSDPVNADRVIRFRASDDTVDRTREVIMPDGWDFTDYIKNPVVMAFHNYQSWPIGKATALGVVDGALWIDAEFDPAEIDDEADKAFQKIKHGSVRAGSVGFIPHEAVTPSEKTKDLFEQYPDAERIYTKQSLLEWTICPVPCNQNALAAALQHDALRRFGTESPDAGSDAAALLPALTALTRRAGEIADAAK